MSMERTCKICERFFGRTREAQGRCTSCGAEFCTEHGLSADNGQGVCLFCAQEFGSRIDALADETA